MERGITVDAPALFDPARQEVDLEGHGDAVQGLTHAPTQDVQFRTDGDVTFSAVERQANTSGPSPSLRRTTPGPETITATASPSGLSGSAVLTEGVNGWFDESPPAPGPSPPAREQSAMAFDAARNRTVAFGGFAGDP